MVVDHRVAQHTVEPRDRGLLAFEFRQLVEPAQRPPAGCPPPPRVARRGFEGTRGTRGGSRPARPLLHGPAAALRFPPLSSRTPLPGLGTNRARKCCPTRPDYSPRGGTHCVRIVPCRVALSPVC